MCVKMLTYINDPANANAFISTGQFFAKRTVNRNEESSDVIPLQGLAVAYLKDVSG